MLKAEARMRKAAGRRPNLRLVTWDLGLVLALMLCFCPALSCRTQAQPAVADPSEVAFRRGDYVRALELVAKATQASRTRGGLLRGLIARQRGDEQTARAEFLRLSRALEDGTLRSGTERADAAEAYQHLDRFHEANRAFDQAAAAAPRDADIRVRWGRLYLLTYNAAEAQRLFEEALKLDATHVGALAGMAEVLSDRWDAGAEKLLARALELDPDFVPAHLLLAQMALEEEQTEKATEHIRRAQTAQPASLEALALSAAAASQRGDTAGTERLVAEALKLNPAYGEIYATLAHFAVMRRQFAEAAELYRRAVERHPTLWTAHSDLGVTLLRLGRDEEARRALENAYKGDAFNVRTVNTLRLMDSFARYERVETPHFRIKLHQKEAAAMRPYVEELLERALRTFAERYRFMPSEKISFEMFPDHEDFAVRALGLPGLGALGVSFGAVVAMDSPAARPMGAFHWASTLWHEVAHVVTLQATANRVPRWFTEGLSVYEEHRAGWGDRMDLDTVRALQENKVMPVAQLNAGFVRPRYPGQVQFAYYQAGMLCRYIAEKRGFDKILGLLAAFRDGEKSEVALARVLGRSLETLDKEFQAWLDSETAAVRKAIDLEWRRPRPRAELEAEVGRRPENFFARLHLARALKQEGKLDEALAHAEAARDLFPAAVEEGNPYELAAEIHLARGRREKAAAELERWARAGGLNLGTGRKLVDLLMELGRPKEAAEILEGFLYIAPLEAELHQKLGELCLAVRRHSEAVREFGAVLALKPVDPAQAHFNLARAYAAAEQPVEARKQVLAALEIAPGFSPAQKLLLELATDEKPEKTPARRKR